MITITAAAAEQIQTSLNGDDSEELKLRIAAKKASDGSFEYAMGLVIDVNEEVPANIPPPSPSA